MDLINKILLIIDNYCMFLRNEKLSFEIENKVENPNAFHSILMIIYNFFKNKNDIK